MKNFTITEDLRERLALEDEFFSKKFTLSYSGLTKLLYSPALFYKHYVLKQREDTTSQAAIEGKLLHCLLLNPEDFEKDFIISLSDLPSENPKKVLDSLYSIISTYVKEEDEDYSLVVFKDIILDILKNLNLYQSLKTDEQRLEKMLIDKHVSYWEYLLNSKDKTLITQEMYDFALKAVEKVTDSVAISKIMGFYANPEDELIIENEIELFVEDTSFEYSIRGIIDNSVIDNINKEIRINDLKKTAKTISKFNESIDFYEYWLQAAIYYMLVKHIYEKQYKDYKIVFRFIVVDAFLQVGSILVSDETMKDWIIKTDDALQKANYHFIERNFDLPYEFIKNGGEITI